MTARKKLIEVALPLDEINVACKADKERKTGTIRNLHKWFAPMPLPAWRALLFAALIDDPGDDERRAYLLDVIKRLVANGADLPDQDVLNEARGIIRRQFPDGLPHVMDPFCGGGSTLVEAQRLGLPTLGSDLNPVPTLITRILTQLLPNVYNGQPLHPADDPRKAGLARLSSKLPFHSAGTARVYSGYDGIGSDVTYYAQWVLDRAWSELEALYPLAAGESPVGWLWARTASCPNPACRVETILATSWWLSKKAGDLAWIEPETLGKKIVLRIVSSRPVGEAPSAPKVGDGVFACVVCSSTLDARYLRAESVAGRMGLRMIAVASELAGKRVYRSPKAEDLAAANAVDVDDTPARVPLDPGAMGVRVGGYGVATWDGLFTPRQLHSLGLLAELIGQVHSKVQEDGGSKEWADAISALLALALGKMAQNSSTQCRWLLRKTAHSKVVSAFDRNDLPMMWDFAETCLTSDSVGGWMLAVRTMMRAVPFAVPDGIGQTARVDARVSRLSSPGLVATDPPYFDAIGYADLSDYFYVWHRAALRQIFPDLYATMATPKTGELTASPSHHGGDKDKAKHYFIEGFSETFTNLQQSLDQTLPMIVVYAAKEQTARKGEETRWAAILSAMVDANLEITGAWPVHGTGANRMRGIGSNAVATYVAMICRPREPSAGTCSLADFNRALRRDLKPAVHDFQAAGILPVDLAQAAMGPGMRVYSRYESVVDQTGRRVPVDQALRLINAALGEVMDEQEGELDSYSRFAVAWWERHGWNPAPFGEADQLARPQGLAVDDLVRAGVVRYPKPGHVEALGREALDRSWQPATDAFPTAWEALHHLADRLIDGGGSVEAGRLMSGLGTLRDPAQALVYRLHEIAVRNGWTKDQERYNALIGSWSDLLAVSATEKEGLF